MSAYPPGWPTCACGWPVLDGHLTCGRQECDEAKARELERANKPDVLGGQYYERDERGTIRSVGAEAPGGRQPDAWICRRVADYPNARVPSAGAVAPCSRCQAPIVFNPKREGVTAPKVCMQCAHIQPLPIDS